MSTSMPLVYSCSGCSSAAQMANDLALKLGREGVSLLDALQRTESLGAHFIEPVEQPSSRIKPAA